MCLLTPNNGRLAGRHVEGANPPFEATMPQRLLLDIGPPAGGHGARGIGSYVRGLIEAIGVWPAERRELVWALAPPGATPPVFEDRTVCSRLLSIRPGDLGWLLSAPVIGRAARLAGADVFHANDPQRPTRLRAVRQVVTVHDLIPVSYTHLRAHETRHDLVCRLL